MSLELINILISLGLIAFAGFIIYKVYPMIMESALADQLNRSLNRLFASKEDQPLYKIFYHFNHKDTESWVAWVKTQEPEIQEHVFASLHHYLIGSPKELGFVMGEIIKAVILFQHEKSFEALKILLENSRRRWGMYQAVSMCYEEAAKGLMQLDPVQGIDVITDEIKKINKNEDKQDFKKFLIEALAVIEDKEKLLKLYLEVALDQNQLVETRLHTLNILKDREEDPEVLFIFLQQVVESLALADPTQNKAMLNACLDKFLELGSNEERRENTWSYIAKFCENPEIAETIIDGVNQKIKVNSFPVHEEYLFKIFTRLDGNTKASMHEALMARSQVTAAEQNLMKEAIEMHELASEVKQPAHSLVNIEASFKLPVFLEATFQKFKGQMNTKPQGKIKVLTGKVSFDKVLMVKAYALQTKDSVLQINTDYVMLAPDKLNEIDTFIKDKKPTMIYLNNCVKFIKTLADNPTDQLAANMLIFIQRHNARLKLVMALDQSEIHMQQSEPKMLELLKSSNFNQILNLGSISTVERQAIYNHYEMQIDPSHPIEIENFEEVLYYTNDLSPGEFLIYTLRYFSASLLVFGKLISLTAYNKLLEEIAKSSEEQETEEMVGIEGLEPPTASV